MITQAIILAGGFGTRLQKVVSDLPKPMADINGKPFLEYLFNYLEKYKIKKVILSVGYKHEKIIEYFGDNFKNIKIKYAVENQPLGTGGAIKFTLDKINDNNFFLINGDTFFDVNLNQLSNFHSDKKADISLSLKPLSDFDRYGAVEIDNNNRIKKFNEKKYQKHGLINGGVYAINKNIFNKTEKTKFSFEKDIMEKHLTKLKMFGFVSDTYFIDIGIPDDYKKAQTDL